MKTKTSTKVFFSTALGSLIGTIVALELPGLFWILGLIVGGLVGYLSYEFKTVLEAIPKAWKAVIAWKIDKIKLQCFLYLILTCSSITLYTLSIPIWIIFLQQNHYSVSLLSILISGIIGIVSIIYVIKNLISKIVVFYENGVRKIREENLVFAIKFLNPIVLPFAASIWFSKMIYKYRAKIGKYIIKTIVGILRFIFVTFWVKTYKFFRYIFIYIHNDIRIICFVDAMIGTAIGYKFGNPMIGCLSGGLLGVINYYIVSMKIMKLKPTH